MPFPHSGRRGTAVRLPPAGGDACRGREKRRDDLGEHGTGSGRRRRHGVGRLGRGVSPPLVGPDAHRVRLSTRHAVTRDASRKRAKRLPQTHARRRHLRQTGGPAACDKAPGRREERPETPAHRADGRHDMRVPVRHSRSTGPKRNLPASGGSVRSAPSYRPDRPQR